MRHPDWKKRAAHRVMATSALRTALEAIGKIYGHDATDLERAKSASADSDYGMAEALARQAAEQLRMARES